MIDSSSSKATLNEIFLLIGMRNLLTPTANQLTVPGTMDRPRPKTPSGYAARSPHRSPRARDPIPSSNQLTVLDNPTYRKDLSNLRKTISNFSRDEIDVQFSKNQTMRGNADFLNKSKVEDPLFKSDRLKSPNRTTMDTYSRGTEQQYR